MNQPAAFHEGPPWNYPEFVVCEGRYFLAHYFVDIPKCPKVPLGGNVACLVWRYDDQPGIWRCSTCFRYYRDDVAHGSADRKSWHFFGPTARDEAQMKTDMDDLFPQISGAAGLLSLANPPPVQCLVVQGDWEKYIAVVEREKPFWLHGP
jgi:hypothetical protein